MARDVQPRGEVVSDLGYFAERTEADGMTYLNTSLGRENWYAEPKSKFVEAEAGYALLTFEKGES